MFVPTPATEPVSSPTLGVVVINFGEPAEPTAEAVLPFLERIFLQNSDLEGRAGDTARARELAENRAPGLLEEYREIGGSPLNEQADAQARALAAELEARGRDVRVYSAFQFTEPSIAACVDRTVADGVERLVAVPVYPLCGQSTTVATLRAVRAALDAHPEGPDLRAVAGWHHHPAYASLRAEHVREWVEREGLDLSASDTLLYFSVHGTPIKYLDEGNRYDRYVEEHCRDIARRLGARNHAVGFQNHGNRRIAWTQPDNEDRIRELAERRLVVVPISFMHEQSETLAELDHELREFVEGQGREFHRVPVPHDDRRFIRFLADLVGALADPTVPEGVLTPCRCSPGRATFCTNGHRDLPASPYAPADVS